MRKLVFSGAVGLLAWAALIVPLPLVVIVPAPAQPVLSVIEVADPADEISGDLLFTAVELQNPTTTGVVEAWRDPFRDVSLPGQVLPEDFDPERFIQQQQEIFAESLRVAAAVGLRAAGREVRIEGGGARVVQLLPGAPAEGALEPGDVIVSAGGEPVSLATELVGVVSQLEEGEEIELTVERDGRRIERTVTVGPLPEVDQVGLGVLIETVDRMISLPVEVMVDEDSRIGGPSAGLMMALTVYDLVERGDLTKGRVIAGTGTVDTSGNVGPVGGVAQKVRGALKAGAEVFLVPTSQLETAQEAAPPDLEVIGIGTVEEAIEALQSG